MHHDPQALLSATTAIVIAAIANGSHNSVADLIRDTHAALAATAGPAQPAAPEPAVPVRQSVRPDHLVCLEDGAKVKMLKRYLRRFDLTPADYRAKWGLPADYPMVAPNYAEKRRAIAVAGGLGRKRDTSEVARANRAAA